MIRINFPEIPGDESFVVLLLDFLFCRLEILVRKRVCGTRISQTGSALLLHGRHRQLDRIPCRITGTVSAVQSFHRFILFPDVTPVNFRPGGAISGDSSAVPPAESPVGGKSFASIPPEHPESEDGVFRIAFSEPFDILMDFPGAIFVIGRRSRRPDIAAEEASVMESGRDIVKDAPGRLSDSAGVQNGIQSVFAQSIQTAVDVSICIKSGQRFRISAPHGVDIHIFGVSLLFNFCPQDLHLLRVQPAQRVRTFPENRFLKHLLPGPDFSCGRTIFVVSAAHTDNAGFGSQPDSPFHQLERQKERPVLRRHFLRRRNIHTDRPPLPTDVPHIAEKCFPSHSGLPVTILLEKCHKTNRFSRLDPIGEITDPHAPGNALFRFENEIRGIRFEIDRPASGLMIGKFRHSFYRGGQNLIVECGFFQDFSRGGIAEQKTAPVCPLRHVGKSESLKSFERIGFCEGIALPAEIKIFFCLVERFFLESVLHGESAFIRAVAEAERKNRSGFSVPGIAVRAPCGRKFRKIPCPAVKLRSPEIDCAGAVDLKFEGFDFHSLATALMQSGQRFFRHQIFPSARRVVIPPVRKGNGADSVFAQSGRSVQRDAASVKHPLWKNRIKRNAEED